MYVSEFGFIRKDAFTPGDQLGVLICVSAIETSWGSLSTFSKHPFLLLLITVHFCNALKLTEHIDLTPSCLFFLQEGMDHVLWMRKLRLEYLLQATNETEAA